MTGRLKFFLELIGFAAGFMFIATAFLLWRATSGPVRLDFLRTPIERELAQHAGTKIPFEHISLGSEHWNAPIMLRLDGVSLPPDRLGFPVTVNAIGLSLSFRDLLQGNVRLMGLLIDRPVITLTEADLEQKQDGAGQGFTLNDLLSPKPDTFLADWRDLSLENGEVRLLDETGQQIAAIHGLQATLERNRKGTDLAISGLAGGTGQQGVIMGAVHYSPDMHGTAHVKTGPLMLGLLGVLPDLKSLAMAQIPASVTLDAEMQGQTPLHAKLDMEIGAGQIANPDIFPAPISVTAGRVQANYDGVAKLLTITQGTLGLDAPELSVTGTIHFGDGIKVDADIGLKHMPIDAFDRYWPKNASPGGRAWVTQNLSHGVVDDEMLHVVAGFGGAAAAEPPKVDGHIAVSNATVHYFGQLPDVLGANADIDFDASHMTVNLTSGNAAGVKITQGKVVLAGFDAAQQTIAIDLTLDGPVSSALTIVNAKPLGYAKKLGMVPTEVQGTATTQFHMDFPLVSTLNVMDTNLHTSSALTGVTLPHVVRSFDLTDLTGTLDIDLNGLALNGHGNLAGIPLQIGWKQAFAASAKPVSDGTFEGAVDDDQRRTLGLDAPDRLTGLVQAKAHYVDMGTASTLEADVDMTPAEFKIGEIGYDKPKGIKGSVRATVEMDHGQIVRIGGINATAKDFLARGEATLNPEDGKLDRLSISPLKTGLTDITIDFQPRQPVPALSVVGPLFDARPMLHQQPDPNADARPAATGDTAPLSLTLDIGEVKAADGPGIRSLKGNLLLAGPHWRQASFTANTPLGKPLSLSYQPDYGPNPGYNFVADVADTGAVLKAFDVTDSIKGGVTHVEGRKPPAADDDPHPPLQATVTIGEFTVVDPPIFARLFSALTVNGFLNSVSGLGLQFASVSGKLSVTHEAIKIEDGKAEGDGIGLTIGGSVDRQANTLDLRGTAVPAYGINTFLNKVPLLGAVFTGGEGEGVFSTTYSITGPVSDPSVFVNPVSLFLPGALRSLFFELPYKMGDGDQSSTR